MSALLAYSKCFTCILATLFLTLETFFLTLERLEASLEVLYNWQQLPSVNNISASWGSFNEPIEIDELIKLANQSS